MPQPPTPSNNYWLLRVTTFMVTSAILIITVVRYYLLPAMAAASHASAPDRRVLRAQAALMLTVLLFVIFVGWLFTFRVGRYFFPRNRPNKRPPATQYPDAWVEAGKRIKPSDDDDPNGTDPLSE